MPGRCSSGPNCWRERLLMVLIIHHPVLGQGLYGAWWHMTRLPLGRLEVKPSGTLGSGQRPSSTASSEYTVTSRVTSPDSWVRIFTVLCGVDLVTVVTTG